MARYKVQGPDGAQHIIEGPDGASPADIEAFAAQSIPKTPAPAAAPPISGMDRLAKGLRDPIDGGAQLLTKVLPDGVVQAGNQLNNFIADKTGLVARLPEGGVDQQVRESEAQYQAGRQAAAPQTLSGLVTGQKPEPGFDGMRMLGNVLSPANLALAMRTPAAVNLAGRVGLGALAGAGSAALSPVAEGDYAAEKAKQIGLGAAFGGVAPVVTGGIARVISPDASVNPLLQLLKKAGVNPTIGQTLGGMANNLEQKATSIPILGGMISKARASAQDGLATAAFNRSLEPVGEKLPAGLAGREAVDHVETVLGNKYNALLPRLTTQADAQGFSEIQNLRQMMANGSIDPAKAQQFENLLQNQVLSKFQPGANGAPTITGQTMKQIETDLRELSSKFGRSMDPDQQMVGDALNEVQSSLRGMVMRSNPQDAPALSKINEAWANFKRVQRAASGLGAEEGNFSPAQLQSAVKASDRSKDKASFARGDALMQDLSEAGKKVLGNNVPDSGTAGRGMVGGMALGLPALAAFALGNPVKAGAVLASPALYTQAGQNLLRAMVSSRPELAQPIANQLRQIAPGLVPAAAQLGLQPLQ